MKHTLIALLLSCFVCMAQPGDDSISLVDLFIGTQTTSQHDHGNTLPGAYNWTGHPWRTQEVVRKTLGDLFQARPDRLPGNDDLGATSSWAVFAHLGLYPLIPGVGGLAVNSPVFPEVVLKIRDPKGGERSLRLVAPGAPDKLYIKRLTLDGKPIRNWWVDWSQLSRGTELEIELSVGPNKEPGEQPPSFAP